MCSFSRYLVLYSSEYFHMLQDTTFTLQPECSLLLFVFLISHVWYRYSLPTPLYPVIFWFDSPISPVTSPCSFHYLLATFPSRVSPPHVARGWLPYQIILFNYLTTRYANFLPSFSSEIHTCLSWWKNVSFEKLIIFSLLPTPSKNNVPIFIWLMICGCLYMTVNQKTAPTNYLSRVFCFRLWF